MCGGGWGEDRGAWAKARPKLVGENEDSTVAGFSPTANVKSGVPEKNLAAKLRVKTQAFHLGSASKDNFRHHGGGTRGHPRPTESRSHLEAQRKGSP